MSKTDKTRPMWVRKGEFMVEHDHRYGECIVQPLGPGGWRAYNVRGAMCDRAWNYHQMRPTNAERGIRPKYAKWAKRMKAKKNRRREVPWTQMRGHGWGEENYRINW